MKKGYIRTAHIYIMEMGTALHFEIKFLITPFIRGPKWRINNTNLSPRGLSIFNVNVKQGTKLAINQMFNFPIAKGDHKSSFTVE